MASRHSAALALVLLGLGVCGVYSQAVAGAGAGAAAGGAVGAAAGGVVGAAAGGAVGAVPGAAVGAVPKGAVGAVGALPAKLPGQGVLPQPQVAYPLARKPTPIVIPAAAKKLFNQPTTGYTASYYGGSTDGGSCGYGSGEESGLGDFTASASAVIFRNGAACGTCLRMTCVGSTRCLPASTPVLTVTNDCKRMDSGGWCAGNKKAFSLAPIAWNQIAVDPNYGVVSVRVTRVPCERVGGVSFKVLVANPYYMQIVVGNVAGSGDILTAQYKLSLPGSTWQPMKRELGAVFSIQGNGNLQPLVGLSFRLTSGYYKETITIPNAIPPPYEPGRIFTTLVNFKLAAPIAGAAATKLARTQGRRAMEDDSFNATLYVRRDALGIPLE